MWSAFLLLPAKGFIGLSRKRYLSFIFKKTEREIAGETVMAVIAKNKIKNKNKPCLMFGLIFIFLSPNHK